MLGNRIGLPYGGYMASLAKLVKDAGGVLYLDARRANGQPYPQLSPRTLPNGIANSPTVQRVSGDIILTSADVVTVDAYSPTRVIARLSATKFSQMINNTIADTYGLKIASDRTTPRNDVAIDLEPLYSHYFTTGGLPSVTFPFGTTLAQARAYLDGTVIRYQLATTIDTLNTPFTNPLIDLTKLGNNATLVNFAATQTDGYTLEATVNSNGSDVDYSNLVVNGDFANGTTGWQAISTTLNVVGGIGKFTATATSGMVFQTLTLTAGKRYYVSAKVKSASNLVQLRDTTSGITIESHSGNAQTELLSGIITPVSSGARNIAVIDTRTSGWTEVELDDIQCILLDDAGNITAFETNQLQKPLDAPACDRIFPFTATTGVTKVSARPYINTDGLDSYGVLANNPSVDITGTEDFAIAWCGITPSTISSMRLIGKNTDVSNSQYALVIEADGSLISHTNISIVVAPAGTMKPNTSYDIMSIRKDGRLKVWINGVLVYDQANVVSLVSQPYLRAFARSNNAGGTSYTAYFKGLTAYLILARGTYGDLDKLDGVLDKVARDYR